MALNPIAYTENVVRSFLRYQLTAYPFADPHLHSQMRRLLSLDETRQSPLLKGPYVSLSRPFRQGASVASLVAEGLLHPHLGDRIPSEITHLYSHQERAIRAIAEGRTTLVSTGTGSGKTECFLYPIISRCLALRDEEAPPGISAVIVYPMNALAEDQLMRLRGVLAGTGIPFGIYVGKTPERETDVAGVRLRAGASRADYEARLARARREGSGETVYPGEEACSREVMRTPGRQPRILLTNVKQLELLLTRQQDIELFTGARLDYLVFDEAHTFTGALGSETACLVRRLRAFCEAGGGAEVRPAPGGIERARNRPGGPGEFHTTCVATSATIVDREDPQAAHHFASRFFGVAPEAVVTVGEDYEAEVWEAAPRSVPRAPLEEPATVLERCVQAVEDQDGTGAAVRAAHRALCGNDPGEGDWPEALHAALSRNELVYRLNEELHSPRALDELPEVLGQHAGRPVTEAEILAWLTLGAAARRDGRPLLRPVVHGFVRGIGGAVVTFPEDADGARLWLAAEDELGRDDLGENRARFPVMTCTTCGQHYYIAFLKDFIFTGRQPGGGEAGGGSHWWPSLEEAHGGKRVVLFDRLIGASDDDGDGAPHARTAPLHFCRQCGTAHPDAVPRCRSCGTAGASVQLHAVRQSAKSPNPGSLTSCLSCGSAGHRVGGRYREPARTVRAITVSDVHVLTQDMVHHAERLRLLVFCDNRQDAAFQAGWMKDHARRFRLRALMAEGIKASPRSIGDLVAWLDDLLEDDVALSRALIPEVWQVARREGTGGRHAQERHKYLRFQVLREVALSSRQSLGLEPWGRMTVEYEGLDAALPWIQERAHALGISAGSLREGVAGVLDYLRRKRTLYDPEHKIFTKYWMEGDREIQQGYLPSFLAPNGTKLRRDATEKASQVTQWLSAGGDTTMRQIARKWGLAAEDIEPFLESLFDFLVDQGLLVAVRLKGARGRPLPNVHGVYQVNADRLRLNPNRGVNRCRSCRRTTTRDLPHDRCPAWRCDGVLEWVREDDDNYDLQLLDGAYSMLRPEEHTAMVPQTERERLENLFKGTSDAVNCLVCTPTLELGIDIGQLDSVLMRNVPPLPANYWQRAGRAGRRHRMAVDLTYCRPVSHDRAYFSDPIKLLSGRIDPPAFNLRNEAMVAKHVHATVIAGLHRSGRDPQRPEVERNEIRDVLGLCLPSRVTPYLFDGSARYASSLGGEVRSEPFDLGALRDLVQRNTAEFTAGVQRVFRQGWPEADADVTAPAVLRAHVESFADSLDAVVARLHRRLRWAMEQIRRLNVRRERQGTLEPEDEALFRRCDNLVKRLKGTDRRSRTRAEGHDDFNTFNVLAAEGFLPGYGLEIGSVVGWAEIPFWRTGAMDFSLPRAPATALREYVPGNLIYANGHRFVARRFHRDLAEEHAEMPFYEVSTERQAVTLSRHGEGSTLGGHVLRTMAVCDADLIHTSHISDEEDLRFQLGVAVYGLELDQHSGGKAFRWGRQHVLLRRGVRMRLVNVGASAAIAGSARYASSPSSSARYASSLGNGEFGYPVCTVCGQSVSPLSSERQREEFREAHAERCRRPPEAIGFYADVTADALSLPECDDATTAWSVLEALRFGAARVLDMHMDDLQILVIGHFERDSVDAVLWDPMPGGSGLLDQLFEHFDEIVQAAHEVVDKCPAVCGSSCVDCLQTFRNAYYHANLDRGVARELLEAWGRHLSLDHEIPPLQPSATPSENAVPVNDAEVKLRHLLLAAGFGEGVRGEQIRLDRSLGTPRGRATPGTTTPDVIYRTEDHDSDEGVCIYLDGMSAHLHGNPETAEQDREIRTWLRNRGYEVIEIPANELDDEDAMVRHFRRLASYLGMRDVRNRVRDDRSWFRGPKGAPAKPQRPVLRLVTPTVEACYVNRVPLVPLQAAAGAFGDPHAIPEESDWEWVELETARSLRPGMFVAQVVGKSMEPRIPDGAYCLFASPVTGTRQGRTVLVQLRDEVDPDTGERYTVKRYRSEKTDDEDGWRHVRILLEPVNPAFMPIELKTDDEGSVTVVAEFVEVIGRQSEPLS